MKSIEDDNKVKAVLITVKGLVQGVGFRPYIYRLATGLNLNGSVENRSDGVFIKLEGSSDMIKEFQSLLIDKAPAASNIEYVNTVIAEPLHCEDFRIIKSKDTSEEITEISPDIAVCDDCLQDLETQVHRIDYPFINCTNCGPRFTIIKDLPYDREKTTMKEFVMCEACHHEYTDIIDRRFHAQPVACNDCGPEYILYFGGKEIKGTEKIIQTSAELLDSGKIIAMKGIGGFHIACDALNGDAVKRLRMLKHRESKPLAVMMKDINTVTRFAIVSEEEEKALTSWRRPIVLLKETEDHRLPSSVSNELCTIGIMLPYMPFHHLLFKELKTTAIVLTSGNISDEPIIIHNKEAENNLKEIYDALLIYNRDIYNRTDDSIVFIANEKERIVRRSRGYVPNPVRLALDVNGIFAAGAELKNTFCIGNGNQAILSQHIGDLKNLETFDFYKETVTQFKKLFRVKPTLAVADMHPDYFSTRFVNEMNITKIFVQHHHAHIASCMAEHKLDEKVIGVSFDGTGYGDDGNIWGGEFFICDLNDYDRISHFEYVPIPGGDRVVDEPWRMAVSYLYKIYGQDFLKLDLPFLKNISLEKIKLILQAIDKKINCPLTSSAGRLFDVVAAITNICAVNGFEAEAPMRLESAIDKKCNEKYDYEINQTLCFDQTIKGIVNDVLNSVEASVISAKFHNNIISVILDTAKTARNKYSLRKVVLSGGVFQNRYLLEGIENILNENNFEVYTHSKVPSNDGGIALGQLAIAAKRRSLSLRSKS
jgi:hydrogenase maturation protein HypF